MLESELNSINLLAREGENGLYGFTHDTFREFFSAIEINRRLTENEMRLDTLCELCYENRTHRGIGSTAIKQEWENIISFLLELCDETVLKDLIKELQEVDMYITSEATRLCGDEQLRQSIVERYVEILEDKETDVNTRFWAAMALGEIGDRAAIRPIFDFMTYGISCIYAGVGGLENLTPLRDITIQTVASVGKGDPFSFRVWFARAFGKVGGIEGSRLLIDYIQDEKNKDYSHRPIRVSAALALGYIGEDIAVQPLIEYLTDDKMGWEYGEGGTWDIEYIAEALRNIRGRKSVKPLIEYLLGGEDKKYKMRVAEALGFIGDREATEPLISVMTTEKSLCRQYVAEALGRIGDARAIAPLLTCLEEEMKSYLRNKRLDGYFTGAVIKALGNFDYLEVKETLTNYLDPEYGYSAGRIARVLGKFHYREAIDKMIALLSFDHTSHNTIIGLGFMEDERAVPHLINHFLGEDDWQSRGVCLFSLDRIGGLQAVAALEELLSSHHLEMGVNGVDKQPMAKRLEECREYISRKNA